MRPSDLDKRAACVALECGECMTRLVAHPDDFGWLPADETIVCEGCGCELVPLEEEKAA